MLEITAVTVCYGAHQWRSTVAVIKVDLCNARKFAAKDQGSRAESPPKGWK